jgi:hypothetical protein
MTQANIYSFLESDDRIGTVLKHLDEAISELDNMDGLVSSYKIHLNVSPVRLEELILTSFLRLSMRISRTSSHNIAASKFRHKTNGRCCQSWRTYW